MKTYVIYQAVLCSLMLLLTTSCGFLEDKKTNKTHEKVEKDTIPYFEGKIKLSESRGLYGDLTKIHTTYWLSEHKIKREQAWGGVYSVLDNYAGIIIDEKKDTVTLYYADRFSKIKNKHTTSITIFKEHLKTMQVPQGYPSPFDKTFTLLIDDYKPIRQVKDSTTIQNFLCDYTLYKDKENIIKQEVFDSKKIKVKRDFLDMVFINLPKAINFPLSSNLRTTVSDINNDSIISGKQTRVVDEFIRRQLRKKDSTINKTSNLKKVTKNKWVKMGLNLLKKGVDLNIHITSEITEFSQQELKQEVLTLPVGDFIEIEDFDDFLDELPKGGGVDFDD